MAAQDLGVVVMDSAAPVRSMAEHRGPCRSCRYFGGYSRNGSQA